MRQHDQTTTLAPLMNERGTGDDDPRGTEDSADEAGLPAPLPAPSREAPRRFYEF
jgi:hypothetical protein